MINKEEVARVAFTVACSFAFLLVVYNLVESVRYNGFFHATPTKKKWATKKKDVLLCHLKQLDDGNLDHSTLMAVLSTLLEYSPFTEAQNQIGKLGYLPKIFDLLNHPDNEVKQKTALVINNLVLNEANQARSRECIPQLLRILSVSDIDISSVEMFTAVLYALTNFTTLDESHSYVLPHVHVLYKLLQECDVVQIKLQVLKILVNLSTNRKICENMLEFDAQLLRCMESFIGSEVNEDFLLRAVTCTANVLEALQRRWRYGIEPSTLATPEFVSNIVQDELLKLSLHENEGIRVQARRCVAALCTPATPTSSEHSLDTLCPLDVLKL